MTGRGSQIGRPGRGSCGEKKLYAVSNECMQLEIPSSRKERERLGRPPVALNNKLTCGESRMIHEPSCLFSPSNYRGCRIHKSSEPLNGR